MSLNELLAKREEQIQVLVNEIENCKKVNNYTSRKYDNLVTKNLNLIDILVERDNTISEFTEHFVEKDEIIEKLEKTLDEVLKSKNTTPASASEGEAVEDNVEAVREEDTVGEFKELNTLAQGKRRSPI